jgi:hypothetical protein
MTEDTRTPAARLEEVSQRLYHLATHMAHTSGEDILSVRDEVRIVINMLMTPPHISRLGECEVELLDRIAGLTQDIEAMERTLHDMEVHSEASQTRHQAQITQRDETIMAFRWQNNAFRAAAKTLVESLKGAWWIEAANAHATLVSLIRDSHPDDSHPDDHDKKPPF